MTEKIKNGERLIIAIDGCSAAGKSTLAAQLSRACSISVVHMDDFFLPFEMRTDERLSQAGGNVHYERFADEVLPFLGSEFSYRPFCCADGTLKPPFAVHEGSVVVEGAYSLHPHFGKYYDIAVFMDISPELQKNRIIERSGEEKWQMFRDKWIPLENAYHKAENTRNKCDIIINAK